MHKSFSSILRIRCRSVVTFLVGSLTLIPSYLPAQQPPTLWTRTFGGTNIDVGYSVQQTRDGGYILAGYTRSYGTTSGRNAWLIKTDAEGSAVWNNTFGGNADDEAYQVQQTPDGGYILAGYTKSFGAGLSDALLIKTDSTGNSVWTRTFGGPQDDEAYAVVHTSDGGYLIAGATSSFGSGSRDAWLVKTDAAGNETWRKTLGGLSSDGARSIRHTSDGGYILAGWTFSYGPGSIGNAWLVRTDSAGNILWHKAVGGTDVDRGLDALQTVDRGYVMTGYTASWGAGLDDMLLVKTDSAGNEQWTKTFGGTGRDYGNSLLQTADGGFIIAGYTLSSGAGGDDLWIVKADASGNRTWSATYGGSASDVAYCVRQTSDGGYVVTGHTLSFGNGVHDVWLIRLAAEATSVTGEGSSGSTWSLAQNYPNPFNPTTKIRFQVAGQSLVTLKIYDLLGREVATLVNEELPPGVHERVLKAERLPSGTYLYRMTAGTFNQTKKLVLLR